MRNGFSPTTMKGVLISETGGTDILEHETDVLVPTLIDGNALVKNEFIDIKYIDT